MRYYHSLTNLSVFSISLWLFSGALWYFRQTEAAVRAPETAVAGKEISRLITRHQPTFIESVYLP